MYDNLLTEAAVTKTTTFSSAGFNLPGGTPRRGLYWHVDYSAATNATGANSVIFQVDHSPDNSSWYPLAHQEEVPIALSTTAQAGEANIKFETSNPYVRLTSTFAGSGTSPTITYNTALSLARP